MILFHLYFGIFLIFRNGVARILRANNDRLIAIFGQKCMLLNHEPSPATKKKPSFSQMHANIKHLEPLTRIYRQ